MAKTPITVAHGDGIGPEIMSASLSILEAAGAELDIETITIGEEVYLKGISTGIEPSAWDSLRRTKVFYKAPITTPQGGGYKSLNVTVRKTLGLFANVRPCVSYHPFVDTKHPGMDVVVVRENEEDLYAGIEYQHTDDVMQSMKLISRPGSEKICRYAFQYAQMNGRQKVTCFTKDNIMKFSDGLFHKVFDEVAKDYPDIESEHWIVDIGAAKFADKPDNFDVVVLPNLYGDILSDVGAQIAGSVGLAGSANIGEHGAMFEAIHGSAPRRAGQNLANPSALLLGGVLMLVHIGQPEAAAKVHNAWLKTIEDGVHTYDIYTEGSSSQKVGTKEFAEAVVERIGQQPETLSPVEYKKVSEPGKVPTASPRKVGKKELVGVDVYLHDNEHNANQLGDALQKVAGDLKLKMIDNRGQLVWPEGAAETFCGDHWRCRFLAEKEGSTVTHKQVIDLLGRIEGAGFDFIMTQNLCHFDGQRAYSLSQGE